MHCSIISELLKSLHVFENLSKICNDEEFNCLASEVELVKVEMNERIFSYGANSDSLYVVIRGRVGIIYPNATLKQLIDTQATPKVINEHTELLTKR